MLAPNIEKALNQQIHEEAYSSHYYLSMASWCDKNGLPGTSQFLYQHSEEERDHMMKLFHYVNDAGGHAKIATIEKPPVSFKSVKDIFEKLLKHEISITASINRLVDTCLKAKDHSSFNFLQWYVAEQHEEEKLVRSILDMIQIAGDKPAGLLMLDKEIAKYAIQKPNSSTPI